jgi:hypothetical protein
MSERFRTSFYPNEGYRPSEELLEKFPSPHLENCPCCGSTEFLQPSAYEVATVKVRTSDQDGVEDTEQKLTDQWVISLGCDNCDWQATVYNVDPNAANYLDELNMSGQEAIQKDLNRLERVVAEQEMEAYVGYVSAVLKHGGVLSPEDLHGSS